MTTFLTIMIQENLTQGPSSHTKKEHRLSNILIILRGAATCIKIAHCVVHDYVRQFKTQFHDNIAFTVLCFLYKPPKWVTGVMY